MTPIHANKAGVRYRYYVSCALHQGRPEQAGSVTRVPAPEIESVVLGEMRERYPEEVDLDDRGLLEAHLERATVRSESIELVLRTGRAADDTADTAYTAEELPIDGDPSASEVTSIGWSRPSRTRRREIVPGQGITDIRPLRADQRAALLRSLGLGRRWLAEIVEGKVPSIEAIAAQEGCSSRHVAMTISLAFLCPDLVRAAVDGSLPRGIGVRTLTELPPEWSRQHRMLGL
jgi:hypothetical protein